MRCCKIFFATLLVATCLSAASAFPKGRPLANKTKFSRERVKLQQQNIEINEANNDSPTLIPRQKALIQFDVLVGILYSTVFFLFPGRTLSLFFQYDFDPSIQAFLHMAVRMIAINHFGYILGLLVAPPDKAVRVATAFLIVGGAFVVYYGQVKLDTAVAFWSCTVLTTLMIVAHLLCIR